MNAQQAAQEIIENAADWGWSLETEQDCRDAAHSYCLDSGDPSGWQEVATALQISLNI